MNERQKKYLKRLEDEVQFRRNLHLHNRTRRGLKNSRGSGPEADSVNKCDLCRPILENEEKEHPRYWWCYQQKLDKQRRDLNRRNNMAIASNMHASESFQYYTRLKRAKNHLIKKR